MACRLGLAALVCCLVACTTESTHQPPPVEVDLSQVGAESTAEIRALIAEVKRVPSDAGQRAALGAAYERSGMLHAAEGCYEQAAALGPDEPRWRYYLAVARARRGNFEAAVRVLTTAIELDASYLPAHVRHGDWLLELGDPDSARAAYDRALALDGASIAARIGVARVLLRSGQPHEAASTLDQIDAGQRDSYFYHLLGIAYRQAGDGERAAEALRRAAPQRTLPVIPDPWLAAHTRRCSGYDAEMQRIQELVSQRKDAEAIALMEQLIDDQPANVALLNRLARAYGRVGRVDDAVGTLLDGLKRFPDNVDLLLTLGQLFRLSGRPDRALTYVERAIELSPMLARAHRLRGGCLIDSGRVDESRRAYNKALRYDPQNAEAHYSAGVISAGFGERDLALGQFERAVELDPELGSAWLALARIRLDFGSLDRAAAALENARALSADNQQLKLVEQELAALKARTP